MWETKRRGNGEVGMMRYSISQFYFLSLLKYRFTNIQAIIRWPKKRLAGLVSSNRSKTASRNPLDEIGYIFENSRGTLPGISPGYLDRRTCHDY